VRLYAVSDDCLRIVRSRAIQRGKRKEKGKCKRGRKKKKKKRKEKNVRLPPFSIQRVLPCGATVGSEGEEEIKENRGEKENCAIIHITLYNITVLSRQTNKKRKKKRKPGRSASSNPQRQERGKVEVERKEEKSFPRYTRRRCWNG